MFKGTKPYWSILKNFLNNKKVPIIPSLFHENEFVTDFEKKAELFNSFFAKQCSLISNDCRLPPDSITLPKNVYQLLNSQVTLYSI